MSAPQVNNPQQVVSEIIEFIQQTFKNQGKQHAVIAVSGGIDSALSLTLLTKALGPSQVTTIFLPYAEQSVEDSQLIVDFNEIPRSNQKTMNIQSMADTFFSELEVAESDKVRRGNIMARCRMIAIFDLAKSLDALVCGTENKSEHYLGYFTRFGDAASDLEPISHLYKTQVRQLADYLKLPEPILTKAPSAGLWSGQTDEKEMGFSYEDADKVLYQLIDQGKNPDEVEGLDASTIQKITQHVQQMEFKLQVPFEMER